MKKTNPAVWWRFDMNVNRLSRSRRFTFLHFATLIANRRCPSEPFESTWPEPQQANSSEDLHFRRHVSAKCLPLSLLAVRESGSPLPNPVQISLQLVIDSRQTIHLAVISEMRAIVSLVESLTSATTALSEREKGK
jgi:hypothetical protein